MKDEVRGGEESWGTSSRMKRGEVREARGGRWGRFPDERKPDPPKLFNTLVALSFVNLRPRQNWRASHLLQYIWYIKLDFYFLSFHSCNSLWLMTRDMVKPIRLYLDVVLLFSLLSHLLLGLILSSRLALPGYRLWPGLFSSEISNLESPCKLCKRVRLRNMLLSLI